MSKLPLLLSVPHAGLRVPPEVADLCILKEDDIIADGDEGAAEIYWPLEEQVAAFVTTDVARAIVDQNRAEDDFRKDGIIKTHTCWDIPVYSKYPSPAMIETLLDRYHRPYHRKLTEMAKSGVVLGVDCHTMAAIGPPIGPDVGQERPAVCISNADGTCSQQWLESLVSCFEEVFDSPVAVNEPFKGGYIIRSHAPELPWVQLELSRAPTMSHAEKSRCVLAALVAWCKEIGL